MDTRMESPPLSALFMTEGNLEEPTEWASKPTKHKNAIEKQPTCLFLTLLFLEQLQLVGSQ